MCGLLSLLRGRSLSLCRGLLGLGVGSVDSLLFSGDDLVKVDPAAFLIANRALESSQRGLFKLAILGARIGSIFDRGVLKEADGGLFEGILASAEELGVIIEGIPLLLGLCIDFLSLLLLLFPLGKLLGRRILLLGFLLRVSGLLVLASLSLSFLLFGHLSCDELGTLEVLVDDSQLVAVASFGWVILKSEIA